MDLSRRSLAWIVSGAIILVVLVAAITWSIGRRPATGEPGPGAENENVPAGVGAAPSSTTRQEVPEGVDVPGMGAKVDANVAVPGAVTDAAPGVTSKFRSFDIKIDGGKFIPDTVIINVGDTAHINFTAVDKDYDFTQPDYGLSSNIAKGKTRVIEGQFNQEGKFIFYCSSCGGPTKGPVGYVIVVPK